MWSRASTVKWLDRIYYRRSLALLVGRGIRIGIVQVKGLLNRAVRAVEDLELGLLPEWCKGLRPSRHRKQPNGLGIFGEEAIDRWRNKLQVAFAVLIPACGLALVYR
ncbi:hypothetical protein C7438_0069 [Brockia lithotrophica]|uniref:Uncharacterized protein n=1 Tax=Brockia lithotrophica TaxID=933949 RepID=A0A660L3F3_9BACL|nr:hypothetical protein C7438_0069 [Brockia lithotrophica]